LHLGGTPAISAATLTPVLFQGILLLVVPGPEDVHDAEDVRRPARVRPPRDDNWYRSTEWNDEIAGAFEAKLARARSSRLEYIRIQGVTLALQGDADEGVREVGRGLLVRFMAEIEAVGGSQARVNDGGEVLAMSLALSGRLRDAADEYWRVLRRIAECGSDSFTTGMSEVLLAEVLLQLGDPSSLAEADALLAGAEASIRRTAFFRDRVVRYLTARARVASRLGDPESASGHAHAALTVLGIEGNPLPRHPGVGVPTVDADLRVELTRLAQGLRPVAARRRSFRFPFRKGRP